MRKDPTLACLLSLLLVGSGHMYLEQTVKGLLILVAAIVLAMTTWGIAVVPLVVWAMYDAYGIAKEMNQSRRRAMADKS